MRYAFADCVLDTDRYELCRTGELVQLQPKVYKLLSCLVQHAERLVTQAELLEHGWPGAYVQPIAIARNISEIRRAVGDRRETQPVIQTLPRQGYRLVAPVTVLGTAAADSAATRERAVGH